MAALSTARSFGDELGGVISIGGPISAGSMLVNGPKIKTPIMLLGGSRGLLAEGDAVKSVQGTFDNVQYHQWKKTGDGMPKDREEALPMMQFFARRLRSRKGVPKGSVEIG